MSGSFSCPEHPLVSATNSFLDEHASFIASGQRGLPPLMSARLLALAAGPYFLKNEHADPHWLSRPLPVAPDLEALQMCLPRLMASDRHPIAGNESTSLLAGLHRYGCWRGCLSTVVGAKALASALLQYIDCYWESYALDATARPGVLQILNEWLRPEVHWAELPGVVTICRHMFGGAWCTIALPADRPDDVGGFAGDETAIELLVHNARPPFMPGLCPAQETIAGEHLPDLGLTL